MAVTNFSFQVIGDTRDKCIEEMDRVALDIMQVIGGSPWLTIDDDVQRRPMSHNPAGEEDFHYHGSKRVIYQGAMKIRDMPLPPGTEPQTNDRSDDDH